MQETKVNTGGPAFPCEQGNTPDGCWNQTFESGMSLRDYFAAKAMQGILANPRRDFLINATEITQQAYQVADAMIKARSK